MWGRACVRWRHISRHMHWLTHRYRGQARSHMGAISLRLRCLGQVNISPCAAFSSSRAGGEKRSPYCSAR
ncbi:hypothetical protein FPT15_05820 [Pseudomonas sp. RGB]|nr:hypothetical protein FPT15_05820 [Pseudomonas sp. RGB]